MHFDSDIKIPRKLKKKIKKEIKYSWTNLNNGQRLWYYHYITNKKFITRIIRKIINEYHR